MSANSDALTYLVVKNHEGRFSIWPAFRAASLPSGWQTTGFSGSKDDCLASISRASVAPTPIEQPILHPKPRSASKATSLPFPKAAADVRLFVFPHAGSGASYYHFLARACKNDPVEIHVVQYPGREMRMQEAPLTNMETMVGSLFGELQPLFTDRPFAFFGHSMGALAAFELAHALKAQGTPFTPTHLFLSGRQAPHLPAANLNVDQLDDSAFLDAVGRRYRALPAELLSNPEIVALILPSLRADFALMERYTHRERPPLDIPITLLNGKNDIWFDPSSIAEWSRHTTLPLIEHTFPGDHFYMSAAVSDIRTLLMRHLLAGRS